MLSPLLVAALAVSSRPPSPSAPVVAAPAFATAEFDQSHSAWTKVLDAHVRGGAFDYAKLKEHPRPLEEYLGSLEAVMPEEFASWKRTQQMAFWIDAYNAYAVKRVVDAYPIESIKELDEGSKTVWQQEFVPLGKLWPEAGDRALSLDEIGNKILRPQFKDARVHAALNGAARGCPPILGEAFVGEDVEKQLDAQVARWLADTSRNRYDMKANKLQLSKIFEWSSEDFVREAGSVRAWVAARAPEAMREWIEHTEKLEIEYLDFSWKLNDAK